MTLSLPIAKSVPGVVIDNSAHVEGDKEEQVTG
jgi:hypothetical protein